LNVYSPKPGRAVALKDFDPGDSGAFEEKDEAKKALEGLQEDFHRLQQRLYAESRQALLVVLQAMDTGGKDGTIRQVMRGANPAGVQVSAFKVPSAAERARDFLWRIHAQVPPKGMIGLFNRSHYEDVVITRVHGWISPKECERRYKHINHFEKLLAQTGTRVVKFFLHISEDEQKERLESRLKDPEKRWKFNEQDLEERKYWKAYMRAYEDAITATNTEEARWHIVPANKKWYRNWAVAKTLVNTLREMKPAFPAPPKLKKVRIV
jgi:PPK2 family polyphosphate:nucleotide phosphotransferase